MTCTEVATQAEFDKAAKKGDCVHVKAGAFTAYGSASVTAYDSASVRAYDSASVTAYDSASVTAYDSASVTAYDSASVTAYDSASVTAYDSASVTAYDSASVTAYDSASVTASKYVAVHVNQNAKVTGGVQIVVPPTTSAVEWCERYGVAVPKTKNPVVVLFKVVDTSFRSPHGFDYTPGTTPVAPDWDGGKQECGFGLHFSPAPFMAERFAGSDWWPHNMRYVACPVRLADIVVHPDASYPDKVKAKGCCKPVYEVDVNGKPVVS